MTLPRRTFLHLVAGAAAVPAVPRIARATQAYPTRPVRIIVTVAPGGGADLTARLIGQWLSERTGQQFFIENRPGGGNSIGTEAVVRASADGYTLLYVGVNSATQGWLNDKLNFVFLRDIAPVAGTIRVPYIMLVKPSFPARSVPEFIAYAKANPGKINMASAGIGGGTHLAGELFKAMTGINLVHVPYRSAGPAVTDLLGGQVQVIFADMASSVQYVRTDKLRGLGVTTAMRSEALPDIPAVGEFVPGYEGSAWFGVGAPRNTPVEIVDRLNKEINAALVDSKMKARIAELGGTVLPGSPTDFGKFIADETEKWGKVIQAANINAE
jgi:tripartite-type tricarboxylate transporter receptor subunit TctC